MAKVVHTAESAHTGADTYRGLYDASSGGFPSGAVAGDFWTVNVAGVIDGVPVRVGDKIIASVTPTQNALWCGEWIKVDVRDKVAPAIVDSDGTTMVTVDLTAQDENRISLITGGTLAMAVENNGRLTLPNYASLSEGNTSEALFVDAAGTVRQGTVVAAPQTNLVDRDGDTSIIIDTGSNPDIDEVRLVAGGIPAAEFGAALTTLRNEVTLPAFPSTRNDGNTTSALYVGAGGELRLGLIPNIHVPVTVIDGNSIDFTASGTDNQTITAEITGIGAATSGQAYLADGAGSGTWTTVSLDTTAIFDAAMTTVVDTDASPNHITMTAGGIAVADFTPGVTILGSGSLDKTTIKGNLIVLPDIPQIDSSMRALYIDGAQRVRSGRISGIADSAGTTLVRAGEVAVDEITLQTSSTTRARITDTGFITNHDIEITGNTAGIILESLNGTRFRLQIQDDGSLKATTI